MTQPLLVDPSRLELAGQELQSLVFPVPPSQIAFTGTDAASAAINETLPAIESPVIDGLPAVKAALTRTGSSMSAAAGMYADTDQRLSDHLDEVQFLTAAEKPANAVEGGRPAGAAPEGAKPDDGPAEETKPDTPADETKPSPTPQPVPSVPQWGQTMGQAQGLMQNAQGAMGSMPGNGSMPAQLSSQDTKADRSPDDDARLVDDKRQADAEDERRTDALAEGATAGDQTSQSAPVQPVTAGRPETTPSGITL